MPQPTSAYRLSLQFKWSFEFGITSSHLLIIGSEEEYSFGDGAISILYFWEERDD